MSLKAKDEAWHKVLHDYHDHAEVSCSSRIGSCTAANRGGVAVPFQTRLHVMLSTVEKNGLSHIVSWQPHGRCFLVHKPKEFASQVLWLYFRQSKITSFQRQLNLYGFSRITTGIDRGAYYHELFLRDKLFLSQNMARFRIKGTGVKGKASPETEPDFYSMAWISIEGEEAARNQDMVSEAAEEMEEERLSSKPAPTKKRRQDVVGGHKKVGTAKRKNGNQPAKKRYPSAFPTPEDTKEPLSIPSSLMPPLPALSDSAVDSDNEADPLSGIAAQVQSSPFILQPREHEPSVQSILSESSISIALSVREPILTPSSSSSSLQDMMKDEMQSLNPDEIFPEEDWTIGGVDDADLCTDLQSLECHWSIMH